MSKCINCYEDSETTLCSTCKKLSESVKEHTSDNKYWPYSDDLAAMGFVRNQTENT